MIILLGLRGTVRVEADVRAALLEQNQILSSIVTLRTKSDKNKSITRPRKHTTTRPHDNTTTQPHSYKFALRIVVSFVGAPIPLPELVPVIMICTDSVS